MDNGLAGWICKKCRRSGQSATPTLATLSPAVETPTRPTIRPAAQPATTAGKSVQAKYIAPNSSAGLPPAKRDSVPGVNKYKQTILQKGRSSAPLRFLEQELETTSGNSGPDTSHAELLPQPVPQPENVASRVTAAESVHVAPGSSIASTRSKELAKGAAYSIPRVGPAPTATSTPIQQITRDPSSSIQPARFDSTQLPTESNTVKSSTSRAAVSKSVDNPTTGGPAYEAPGAFADPAQALQLQVRGSLALSNISFLTQIPCVQSLTGSLKSATLKDTCSAAQEPQAALGHVSKAASRILGKGSAKDVNMSDSDDDLYGPDSAQLRSALGLERSNTMDVDWTNVGLPEPRPPLPVGSTETGGISYVKRETMRAHGVHDNAELAPRVRSRGKVKAKKLGEARVPANFTFTIDEWIRTKMVHQNPGFQ